MPDVLKFIHFGFELLRFEAYEKHDIFINFDYNVKK